MLIETGRVVALENDSIWVETIRQSTCGSCAARKGCGHGLLSRFGEGKRGYIRVLPGSSGTIDCELDDQVRISIPEEVILRGSVVVYVLPLILMLGGAALGSALGNAGGDLAAGVGAALGFGLGFAGVRLHAWRHRDDRSMQPAFVDVVKDPASDAVELL